MFKCANCSPGLQDEGQSAPDLVVHASTPNVSAWLNQIAYNFLTMSVLSCFWAFAHSDPSASAPFPLLQSCQPLLQEMISAGIAGHLDFCRTTPPPPPRRGNFHHHYSWDSLVTQMGTQTFPDWPHPFVIIDVFLAPRSSITGLSLASPSRQPKPGMLREAVAGFQVQIYFKYLLL